MSYRFMRLIVMFDLPMLTSKNKQEYTRFRKYLIKSGFIMMQQSVYTKLAINQTVLSSIKLDVRKNLPSEGLIEMLDVTEKQFNKIEYLSGNKQSKIIETDERLIIL